MKRKALSVLLVLALVIGSMTVNSGKVYAEISVDGNWEYVVKNGEAYIKGYRGMAGETIIIPSEIDGIPVRGIGNGAFEARYNLETVVIPDTVQEIGSYAFHQCFALKSVNIPEGITRIEPYTFSGCSLENVNIPHSVTYIGDYAFSSNKIGSADLSNVTEIGNLAFGYCDSLQTVIFSDALKIIGDEAFEKCSSLQNITLPEGLEVIGKKAFQECTSLTSVVIPSSVNSLGDDAFMGCSDLVEATVLNPNVQFGHIGVGSEGTFPSQAVIVGYDPSTAKDYAMRYGRVFRVYGSSSGGEDWIEGDWQYRVENGEAIITMYFGPGGEVVIPSTTFGGYPVKEIANIGRMHQGQITSIVIPEGVERIGDNAFNKLYYMESIVIPNTVREIGNGAFKECSSLESVSLPEGLTAISSNLFNGCTSLQSVYIPSSVREIGNGAFKECSSLESVSLPEGLTVISSSLFEGCTSLQSVYIPSSVTTIEGSAFYGCSSLTGVSIPNNVTSIGSDAFQGCSSLTGVNIPNNVTSIGSNAFQGCTSLTEIVIPSSVKNIGYNVFKGCTGLTSITFEYVYTSIGNSPDTIPAGAVIKGYTGSSAEQYANTYGRTFIAIDPPPSQPPLNFTYTIEDGEVTITGYIESDDSVVDIPESIEGYPVTKIDTYAFIACFATTINLPSTLEIIDFGAFDYCRNLTSITIPSSVVTIEGYAFNACESLTEVIILNPNAYIGDYAETFPEQAKIVGYDPSTAKDYAIKYGRTFEVYGGGQPSDGEDGTGDGSNIQIIGEVGASTITITAPLVVSFSIDPNNKERPLVTEDLVLSNEGNAAVNVYVKSIESQDMQIVPSTTHSPEEWKRLSKFETERKLALLLGGKDLANADNLFLVTLKGKETKSLPVDVKHGLAFPMAKSCSIQVVLSYSLN